MSGSIKASLFRMRKSKALLFSIIFQIGFALVVIYPTYGAGYSIGGMLIADSLISMFLSAFFVPFFLHDDYCYGLIRNKIIMGHTRTEIYLSNYISALVGSSVIFFTPIIVAFVLAPFMGGSLGIPAGEFALRFVLTFAVNAAMCGVYVLTVFLLRSAGAAASLIITFAMFTVSIFCTLNVYSPEGTAEIGITFAPMLSKALCIILPTSHTTIMMATEGIKDIAVLPLYSALIAAVTVISGILLFRKKDIK